MLTTGHPTPNQCEASAEKLQTSRVHARLVGLRAPTAGAAPQLGSSLVRPPETWRNRRCPVRIQGPESSAKGHSLVEKPLQPVQGLVLTGSHPGPLALKMTLSAIAFRSPPDTSTTERHFRCGPVSSFFLELLVIALCSSCSCPYHIGHLLIWGWGGVGCLSGIISFCLCIPFKGSSWQEYWEDLPFPPPVDQFCQNPSLCPVSLGWPPVA